MFKLILSKGTEVNKQKLIENAPDFNNVYHSLVINDFIECLLKYYTLLFSEKDTLDISYKVLEELPVFSSRLDLDYLNSFCDSLLKKILKTSIQNYSFSEEVRKRIEPLDFIKVKFVLEETGFRYDREYMRIEIENFFNVLKSIHSFSVEKDLRKFVDSLDSGDLTILSEFVSNNKELETFYKSIISLIERIFKDSVFMCDENSKKEFIKVKPFDLVKR